MEFLAKSEKKAKKGEKIKFSLFRASIIHGCLETVVTNDIIKNADTESAYIKFDTMAELHELSNA